MTLSGVNPRRAPGSAAGMPSRAHYERRDSEGVMGACPPRQALQREKRRRIFRSGLTNYVQMKYDRYATQLAIADGRQSMQGDGVWLKDGLGQGDRHPFEQQMCKTNPICRRGSIDKFFYEKELRETLS